MNLLDKMLDLSWFINPRYVITAAHCFDQENPDNFDVSEESLTLAFGLDNITVLENPLWVQILKIQTRKIKKIHVHDAYSYPAANNDIAVVELSNAVELGNTSFEFLYNKYWIMNANIW